MNEQSMCETSHVVTLLFACMVCCWPWRPLPLVPHFHRSCASNWETWVFDSLSGRSRWFLAHFPSGVDCGGTFLCASQYACHLLHWIGQSSLLEQVSFHFQFESASNIDIRFCGMLDFRRRWVVAQIPSGESGGGAPSWMVQYICHFSKSACHSCAYWQFEHV